jgi:hypothetical protein
MSLLFAPDHSMALPLRGIGPALVCPGLHQNRASWLVTLVSTTAKGWNESATSGWLRAVQFNCVQLSFVDFGMAPISVDRTLVVGRVCREWHPLMTGRIGVACSGT